MKNIEPAKSRARWLTWSGMHAGVLSWGGSLLLKWAFLGAGLWFVYWVGWPQPSLSSMAQLATSHPAVLAFHTLPLDSTDHPEKAKKVGSLSGKDVVQPLQAMLEGKHGQPREVATLAVDLNDGTSAEFEHLPGIGPVLAGRIVAHRASHGAFRRVEDLVLVPGIGEKRFQQLRPFIGVREQGSGIGFGS